MAEQSKLLILTDDPNQLLALSEFLGYEYEVLTASNGKEGLDIVTQYTHSINIIMTELKALKHTGLDVLTRTKQEYPSLQILVITEESALQSLHLGERNTLGYILEPLSYDDLKSSINSALKLQKTPSKHHNLELQDLIQLYCVCEAQVVLTVSRTHQQDQGERGNIYFEDGEITHTVCYNQEGEDALYRLMMWENAIFSPSYNEKKAEQKTIQNSWKILLQNARIYALEHPEDLSPENDLSSSASEEVSSPSLPLTEVMPHTSDREVAEVATDDGDDDDDKFDQLPEDIQPAPAIPPKARKKPQVSPQLQRAIHEVLEELRSQFENMSAAIVVNSSGQLVSSVLAKEQESHVKSLNTLFRAVFAFSQKAAVALNLGAIGEVTILGQSDGTIMFYPIKNFGVLGVATVSENQGMVRWNCNDALHKIDEIVQVMH